MKQLNVVDMFCGAGGTSSGLYEAANDLRLSVNLMAINHWEIAIATHSANHTHAQHVCETMDSIDPRKLVPGGRLHLLVASPECTHHSNARGGKPRSDQSRASAWHIVRWAEAMRIENILIENVREFISWGPLDAKGQPLKSRKGETFHAFLNALRSLGYVVDYRVLNAADYGDPTTRERLFVMARKGRKGITWPAATHGKQPGAGSGLKPWRAAREIIDWKISGKSIFTRARPLSPNTMRRIEAGLRKFSGISLKPFICEYHSDKGSKERVRSVEEPLPTIDCSNRFGLAQPFLVKYYGTGTAYSINDPMDTVTGKDRFGLCNPFVVGLSHTRDGSKRLHSLDKPLPTQVTKAELGLVEPFLVPFFGEGKKQKPRCHSISEPMPTITGRGAGGLVEPVRKGARLDIRFRMLQPQELARAQSFKDSYKFTGTREQQVKQIGNAVPTQLARALCRAVLEGYTS